MYTRLGYVTAPDPETGEVPYGPDPDTGAADPLPPVVVVPIDLSEHAPITSVIPTVPTIVVKAQGFPWGIAALAIGAIALLGARRRRSW